MSLLRLAQIQEPYKGKRMSKKDKIVETARVLNEEAEKLGINLVDYDFRIVEEFQSRLDSSIDLLRRNSTRKLRKTAEEKGRSRAVTYSPFEISLQACFMHYAFKRTGEIPGFSDPLAFADPGVLEDFKCFTEQGSFNPLQEFMRNEDWKGIKDKAPYLVELIMDANRVKYSADMIGRDILKSDRVFQIYVGKDGELYVPLRPKELELGRTLKLQNLVDNPRVREALLKEELPADKDTVNMVKNLTYLAGEAERYQEVRQVARGMKDVYRGYKDIVEAMGKLRK